LSLLERVPDDEFGRDGALKSFGRVP